MIHDIKYNLCFDIIPTLSSIMAEYLKFYKFEDDFVLTSVPLHNSKKKVRGFNQAELLARGISDIRNIPYSELLIRSVKTKTQVGLKKSARESNLKGSFRVNNCLLESKQIRSVMVIDDVFTTGATLSECAKKLKESGVEKVYGFVLAKSRQ
jgi:competence protein ComFC